MAKIKRSESIWAYKCYLGRDLGFRVQSIYDFLRYGGREFFSQYSTEIDTIADFINRCDAKSEDLLPR